MDTVETTEQHQQIDEQHQPEQQQQETQPEQQPEFPEQQQPPDPLDELADEIQKQHDLARLHIGRSLAAGVAAGKALIRAKAAVGHGQFQTWVADNLPEIPLRTARHYMSLAERAAKRQAAAVIPSSDDVRADILDLAGATMLDAIEDREAGRPSRWRKPKAARAPKLQGPPAFTEADAGNCTSKIEIHERGLERDGGLFWRGEPVSGTRDNGAPYERRLYAAHCGGDRVRVIELTASATMSERVCKHGTALDKTVGPAVTLGQLAEILAAAGAPAAEPVPF